MALERGYDLDTMIKSAMILVALAGCGGGDDAPSDPLHELVACTRQDTAAPECERPCAAVPVTEAQTCLATHPDDPGDEFNCTMTFEFEGTRGCCFTASMGIGFFFAECE